jgi:hypothetical protein
VDSHRGGSSTARGERRDGPGELQESSAAARGNGEVRVQPQFENGWHGIIAHLVMAVAASKLVGSLAASAHEWTTGLGTKGEAMARSDVGGKEVGRKGSKVGGRHLFKAEVG